MKEITCEMCGSNDIVKQDGFFVCQHCGTKYSLEEAKKLLGTVKIDTTDELNNLYILARRAREENHFENAHKYYGQILLKDPSSWEANFYSNYYYVMGTDIKDLEQSLARLQNCEGSVLRLIQERITNPTERYKAVDEVASKCIECVTIGYNSLQDCLNSIPSYTARAAYTDDLVHKTCNLCDVVYHCGDLVEQIFGAEYTKQIGIKCWKKAVDLHQTILKYPVYNTEPTRQLIAQYCNKIQRYDPSYQVRTNSSNGGCYIATAVYGSYDCPEVWTLRRFRDYSLSKTWYGRAFIHTYYAISPTLVEWFGETIWFKDIWKPKLDRMVKRLNSKGFADTPYQDRNW